MEAYIGEYASGKSENAVNRALYLKEQGRSVTIADLDLVEPFYTLRPIKKMLEEKGLNVIAFDTKQTMGLGEAGNVITPQLRWVLKQKGDIVIDVGYGVEGAKTLNLLFHSEENPYLKIYAVINASRPMTSTVKDIVEYIENLGRIDGLINNTHLSGDTDVKTIQMGAKIVTEAARILNLSVIATTAEKRHQESLGERESEGNNVFYITRHMPHTFW